MEVTTLLSKIWEFVNTKVIQNKRIHSQYITIGGHNASSN